MPTKRTNSCGSLGEIVCKTVEQSKLPLFMGGQADERAARSTIQLTQIIFSVICLGCEGKRG